MDRTALISGLAVFFGGRVIEIYNNVLTFIIL